MHIHWLKYHKLIEEYKPIKLYIAACRCGTYFITDSKLPMPAFKMEVEVKDE